MDGANGVVFDIEEFAVYDGPGIRSVVFLKGCPLRCRWCHNPEGLSALPQRCVTKSLCITCGACRAVCKSPAHCVACGACVPVCPKGAIRIVGQRMTARQAADKVLRNRELLQMNGGGVTFSGGEALLQPDFVVDARRMMPDLHAAIETSGYAPRDVFDRVTAEMDLVIMDVKLADDARHREWTGVSNTQILDNLSRLIRRDGLVRIRVPLIPGVNDDPENMERTARLIEGAKNLEKVELLRYNRAAGAKYGGLGMTYDPGFLESAEPDLITAPFSVRGMEVNVL